jgi:hypothetical protein
LLNLFHRFEHVFKLQACRATAGGIAEVPRHGGWRRSSACRAAAGRCCLACRAIGAGTARLPRHQRWRRTSAVPHSVALQACSPISNPNTSMELQKTSKIQNPSMARIQTQDHISNSIIFKHKIIYQNIINYEFRNTRSYIISKHGKNHKHRLISKHQAHSSNIT